MHGNYPFSPVLGCRRTLCTSPTSNLAVGQQHDWKWYITTRNASLLACRAAPLATGHLFESHAADVEALLAVVADQHAALLCRALLVRRLADRACLVDIGRVRPGVIGSGNCCAPARPCAGLLRCDSAHAGCSADGWASAAEWASYREAGGVFVVSRIPPAPPARLWTERRYAGTPWTHALKTGRSAIA
jgi:hypothetical protein